MLVIDDVTDVINEKGLPNPDPALLELLLNSPSGPSFVEALRACTDVSHKRLNAVLRCLGPDSLRLLRKVCPNLKESTLLQLAETNANQLGSVLTGIRSGRLSDEAKNWFVEKVVPPQADLPLGHQLEGPRSGDEREEPKSVHAYGQNYAITFNFIFDLRYNNRPSVMVDAAASAGARRYDWSTALHFQLDVGEMAMVVAVLLGLRNEVEFSGHQGKRKSFSMARQTECSFYCAVRNSAEGDGRIRGVKINDVTAATLAPAMVSHWMKANPMLSASEHFQLLRGICQSVPLPKID